MRWIAARPSGNLACLLILGVLVIAGAGASPVAREIVRRPDAVVAVVSGTDLGVSWRAPTDGPVPTNYDLNFLQGSTPIGSLRVGPVTSTSIPIPPGIRGDFALTMNSVAGMDVSEPTAPVFFRIGPSCSLLAAPTGLTGSIVNGTANVRWNNVIGARGYFLQAGSAPGTSNFFSGNVGMMPSLTAPGLPPSFDAWLRVAAVNDCGQTGPFGETFHLITDTIAPPPPVICVTGTNSICAFNNFMITTTFRTQSGQSGPGTVRSGDSFFDGGYFEFAGQRIMVQIIDECANGFSYRVRINGGTLSEVRVFVADTRPGGTTRDFVNPLGSIPNINYPSAFPCAPPPDPSR